MFEIGLIITLLISISGMINGLSGQFVSLLTQPNSNSISYLMIQKNATLETSKIPVKVIKNLDTSYFTYATPMVYETASDPSNQTLTYVYANVTALYTLKKGFLLKDGTLPNKTDQILIGEGLQQQLFQNITIPAQIQLRIGTVNETKTITGIFSDNSFYNYGILDEIGKIWTNLTTISLFQFQIKNDRVYPAFQASVQGIINNVDPGFQLDISPIQKSNKLSESFYNDIYNLFDYLQIILLLLLALKITHASYTLYNRYYKDLMILKVLGTSGLTLQLEFYTVIAIIGNLGIAYGLVIGIALPHVFLLIIRIFVQYQGLYIIIPSLFDIFLMIIITNAVILLNSLWVIKLHLKDKLVNQN